MICMTSRINRRFPNFLVSRHFVLICCLYNESRACLLTYISSLLVLHFMYFISVVHALSCLRSICLMHCYIYQSGVSPVSVCFNTSRVYPFISIEFWPRSKYFLYWNVDKTRRARTPRGYEGNDRTRMKLAKRLFSFCMICGLLSPYSESFPPHSAF